MFIMLLMAFVLTLLALPAAAQTSASDSTTVTTVVVDELVVKARQPEMPVIPESDARMRAESYTFRGNNINRVRIT